MPIFAIWFEKSFEGTGITTFESLYVYFLLFQTSWQSVKVILKCLSNSSINPVTYPLIPCSFLVSIFTWVLLSLNVLRRLIGPSAFSILVSKFLVCLVDFGLETGAESWILLNRVEDILLAKYRIIYLAP